MSRFKALGVLLRAFPSTVARAQPLSLSDLQPTAIYRWAVSVRTEAAQCNAELPCGCTIFAFKTTSDVQCSISIKTLATAIASCTSDPQATLNARSARHNLEFFLSDVFVGYSANNYFVTPTLYNVHQGTFLPLHGDVIDPPYIDIEASFFLPKASPPEVFDTLIHVAGHKILITGYLDDCLGPNPNLQRDFPLIPWKGEIAVLFIGKRRPYVSCVLPRSLIHFAIVQYMQACIAHVEIGSPFPSYTKRYVIVRLWKLYVSCLRVDLGIEDGAKRQDVEFGNV
ncbi:hypothetical protein EDB83DRAFT_2316625 [Lactarius deliciosus]|nr:hypothetical protein EDB83DRAFT_2316625 [Lactarius deliciosus]